MNFRFEISLSFSMIKKKSKRHKSPCSCGGILGKARTFSLQFVYIFFFEPELFLFIANSVGSLRKIYTRLQEKSKTKIFSFTQIPE